MSKTTSAMLMKFIMTFVFAWLAFGVIDGNAIGWILALGVVATAVNYIMGDLMVLPKFGNIVASIGDGAMGAIVAFIFALIIPAFTVSSTALITFLVLIAIGEYFFHQYLQKSDKVAP